MSKWVTRKLGNEIDFLTGFPFKSVGYLNEGIKLLRGDNIAQGKLSWGDAKMWPISEQKAYKIFELQESDVVLAMDRPWIDAGLKYAAISKYDLPCLLVQRTARLRGKDHLDTKFLKYVIGGPQFTQYIQYITTGSIVPHISGEQIKDFSLQLPPLDIQKKIAAVLTALDAKIDCNNRINAELEAMAKTLYDYWFVQFNFPDHNGKPYKSSGGKMVYNSTLKRQIPAGWESAPLSEWIAYDKTGDWGKESIEGNYTLQVECIRGTDINGLNGTGAIAAPTRFILKKNKGKILVPFDFVIEISGGSPTQSTGRMAFILPETIKRFAYPIICSNFCKAIYLKDNSYFFNFAYEWQSAYDNKILFGWEGKTSGIKNLLFNAFVSKYIVCKPPQKFAQRFFEFVSPLQIKKQKLLQENETLEALRDWLLPMLMNGQVAVV